MKLKLPPPPPFLWQLDMARFPYAFFFFTSGVYGILSPP